MRRGRSRVINVSRLITKSMKKEINFIILVKDYQRDMVYLQGNDIKILNFLLPEIIGNSKIINSKNEFYCIINKNKVNKILNTLFNCKINYSIFKFKSNRITVESSKNFFNDNCYNFYNKSTNSDKTFFIEDPEIVKGDGKNKLIPKQISKSAEKDYPALRINQKKDLSHLDKLADSRKAIQRMHRKNKPDPEKPTWGDMRAKRFGDFFKD